MPTNPLKYALNFKDVTRPEILKRDNYKCRRCHIPNKIRFVRNRDGSWTEADDHVKQWAKKHNVKISTAVLTIAHLNHLTWDDRPENLATLCAKCHLMNDRSHKAMMKVFGPSCNVQILTEAISEPGGEKLLNHGLEAAKVLGRQYKTMIGIYEKRHTKGYDSKYDRDIKQQADKFAESRSNLIKAIAQVFKDLYNVPDSMDFVEDFLKHENRLIGIKN